MVALRKESVDRNTSVLPSLLQLSVALRKESVDRNCGEVYRLPLDLWSLSARRAWIEMYMNWLSGIRTNSSLSARRAWIEIP